MGFNVDGCDVGFEVGFNKVGWDVEMELGITDGYSKREVGYHNEKKWCAHFLLQPVHVCLTFAVGLAYGEALMDGVDKEVGSCVGPCVAHDMEPQRHNDGNSDSTFWHADASLYPWALCNHNILAPQL